MDDTSKAYAKPLSWSDSDHYSSDSYISPDPDRSTVPEPAAKKPESTGEKALDRWFRKQRPIERALKRLNITNELLVTAGGPLKMTGNITLIHEDGSVTHSNSLSLCRCGASNNKPFCDDQHLDIEFLDRAAVSQFSNWIPINRPQAITVTCVKNGPLRFRGYLRTYNKKGQECTAMHGALCRCGKSSQKPFCDNRRGCSLG